ncbi:MAG: hypothetical protein H6592_00975 [Flavobacteriales bacterium]|nr:hypothetical protein [Flavobacteriales bacterium]
MRFTTIILLSVVPLALQAQCGPYVGHAIAPATEGSAFMNLQECGATDCMWDTGASGWSVSGLSVGTHYVTLLDGTTPLGTQQFVVEQLAWDLGQQVLPYAGDVQVSIWAELPYCGTQVLNFHDCPPEPATTWVYLLQDGLPIESLNPVTCPLLQHSWGGLPFGHTYATALQDLGLCGSSAQGATVTAYSLAGAQFTLDVQGSTGANGTIAVESLTPAAEDPFSPPGAIAGNYLLLTGEDEYVQGPQEEPFFGGLAPGTYKLVFVPQLDVLCSTADTVTTVPLITGLGEELLPALGLWPQPAQDLLHWSAPSAQLVEVLDAAGRLVVRTSTSPPLQVGALTSGSYTLRLADGRKGRFVVVR